MTPLEVIPRTRPVDERIFNIRFMAEALIELCDAAGCDVAFGEPDYQGFVEPVITRRPVRKATHWAGPIPREDVEDFYGGVAPEGRPVL